MTSVRPSRFQRLVLVACAAAAGAWQPIQATGPSELDAFMEGVLARRDDNWRKLQQYVLDERETVEVLAPGRIRLFGLAREYTWFLRDGFFVRSPLRFDGVTLSDAERRDYERDWLAREQRRDARRTARDTAPDSSDASSGLEDVVRQVHEPYFVSAAYFLKFVFEPGRYALVGTEELAGRRVVRIEYYPSRMFQDSDNDHDAEGRRDRTGQSSQDAGEDERLRRQMNKVALVTLWIEPTAHQIVKYTFDNIGFDFLPGRSLVRVDEVRASMRMGEPFPGVWLPGNLEGRFAATLAKGTFEVRYEVEYSQYRQAEVSVKVR